MSATPTVTPPPAPGAPLTKKILTADHPPWCPGCGDFAVLASFYRVLEKLQYPHEKIVTFAGIGCSSRFPYFVHTHGGHYIHGRPLPFAAGSTPPWPGLAPCESLNSIIFTCGSRAFCAKRSALKLPSSLRHPK